ncbi:MAG TPA: hypothetical protein VIY53_16115 [Acidobacteriaceae bacterium]
MTRQASLGRSFAAGVLGVAGAMLLAWPTALAAQSSPSPQSQSSTGQAPAPAQAAQPQDPTQSGPPAPPDPTQATPAELSQPPGTNDDTWVQPLRPVPLAAPVKTEGQTVNATGGLITSHPADIFTTQGIYNPVQPHAGAVPDMGEAPPEPVINEFEDSMPNLVDLNQNAATRRSHDFDLGPFDVGSELTGTYTTNIFDNYLNGSTTGGGYFDGAIPLGYTYKSDITTFGMLFRGDYARYPGHSELNHHSEIYDQSLTHQTSDITTWKWSVASGRVVAVEDYLAPVISIGSTGVAQPSFASGLHPMYNGASTLEVIHQMSDTDTLKASATGGWLQEPFTEGAGPVVWNRESTGGVNVAFLHALNPRQGVGFALDDVYIRGMSPVGRANFASVEGTFQQALFEHVSVHVGAGPMYGDTASTYYPGTNSLTYAADASINYKAPYGNIGLEYERILQVGYLQPASPAQMLMALYDRPLSATLNLTANAQYIRADGPGIATVSAAQYSNFGMSSRLSKSLTPHLSMFVQGDVFYQGANNTDLGTNSATAGLSWSLGNPFVHSGVQ